MQTFRCRVLPRLLLLGLVTLVAGCGRKFDYGDTGRITGRLTLNGKPLSAGHGVTFFQPEAGYLAYGVTDADGNFEVKSFNDGKMPVGKYRVMIGLADAPAPKEDHEMTAEERFDNPDAADADKRPLDFPRKYANHHTSGLEYDINPGSNNVEIDLKSGR